MIKAVMKLGKKLAIGEHTSIVMHNYIPADGYIREDDLAYNSFAISLNNGLSFEEALKAEVRVVFKKLDVKLKKVDVNDTTRFLAGAQFVLYEEGAASDGSDLLIENQIETDANGEATLSNLVVGKTYYLLETKAPVGYQKSNDKIFFTVKSETEDANQTIQVTNDIPHRNITIQKKWIGPVNHTQITVHLYANGVDTGKSVQLVSTNHWQATMQDIPVLDSAGHTIVYSVVEESLTDYSVYYDGDQDQGFTITNTNTTKIDFDVEKMWPGTPTGQVTVQLLADGVQMEQVLLSSANAWQHVFTSMDQYDPNNGHEINYTATETPIAGYDTEIYGDHINGIMVKNVEQINIPVIKQWIGEKKDHVKVRLYADGDFVDEVILDETNAWGHIFQGYDKYDRGD